MKSHPSNLTLRLLKAALRSQCRYRIAAVSYDYRGRIIGITTNQPRSSIPDSRDFHAEELAIFRLPRSPKKISILRVGARGQLLPISPCSHCMKLARDRGVTITPYVQKGLV